MSFLVVRGACRCSLIEAVVVFPVSAGEGSGTRSPSVADTGTAPRRNQNENGMWRDCRIAHKVRWVRGGGRSLYYVLRSAGRAVPRQTRRVRCSGTRPLSRAVERGVMAGVSVAARTAMRCSQIFLLVLCDFSAVSSMLSLRRLKSFAGLRPTRVSILTLH